MLEPVVNVIVPVYRGLEVTRRCLTAVLARVGRTPFELIVVNDATPEPELAAFLEDIAGNPQVRLITHETNQGFVASVNEAMALHGSRDVVLLNSDTEVAGDWLDRLRQCANSAGDVATVTPFSNNATICSYPRIATSNALPDDLRVEALDALFKRANRGLSVAIPTGVGFCLYIPARARATVGAFDEQRFGLGYGEEVDFCMKAQRLGLRHLLCADTFVFHHGEVSFLDRSAGRKRDAQAVIDAVYPEFPDLVREFIARDPARPLRRAVDLLRLATSPLPRLLFVSHDWGGGVARHVTDLAGAISDRALVLLLQPYETHQHALRWLGPEEEFAVYFDLASELPALLDLLSGLGVARVHYHHLQGMPRSVLHLAERLGVPYDCTLHDYFTVCPQFHFVDEAGNYCGEPGPEVCAGCLAARPPQWDLSIGQWRNTMLAWLAQAERVIVPSHDAAQRMGRYAKDLPLVEWPHLESGADHAWDLTGESLARRKILILGSLSDAKGLALVAACARHAAEQALPLHFRVIGSVSRLIPTWPQANLSVFGEYDEQQLPEILRQERPDAFLFASIIPETYSYTLTVAMQTGLPILASRIGAFPERLAQYPDAVLLDPVGAIEDWVTAIASVPTAYRNSDPARGARYLPMITRPEVYAAAYLAPLPSALPPQAPPLVPSYRFFFAEAKRRASPPLDLLYEEGVLCGKREAREQLQRAAATVAARLREQQGALALRESDLSEARRALAVREGQVQELERAISIREAQVQDLEQAVAVREAEAQELDQAIAVREAQVWAFEDEVLELKQTLGNFGDAHDRHVGHLEDTIEALRQRTAELEQSTFWRMTAPLRWSAHQVKRLGSGVQAAPTTLPRAAALARRIVAEEGVRGLVVETRRRAQVRRVPRHREPTPDRYRVEPEIQALTLPCTPAPEVSVIVPTYGQHDATFTCLKSIAANTDGLSYECLVVDDHFADPLAEALALVSGLRIVRNDENLGFLRSCNRAAAAARGQYLVFLNNDTQVLPGWLDALLRTAKSAPDVGAVGAKLIFPNGRLQEAGGIVWKDGSAWNWGRGQDPEDPRFQYVRQVDYCSAACLLVPATVFAAVGGFDERYAPAYYEDTDLCFALHARGLRVIYQPAAQVVHFEGVSH
ncbi:MAG TPA: glycosyltransferase, partial [Lamprocystis sp. (in: g-proteobacteria)]|nr:glycosyltransferase [Lamprocystis sp. (in: g-proteobacteria)]